MKVNLEDIKAEKDELKKMLLFMSWLNRKLKERGVTALPIVVGGSAVEIYTFGRYISGDIDLVTSNRNAIRDILLSTNLFEDRKGFLFPRSSDCSLTYLMKP